MDDFNKHKTTLEASTEMMEESKEISSAPQCLCLSLKDLPSNPLKAGGRHLPPLKALHFHLEKGNI